MTPQAPDSFFHSLKKSKTNRISPPKKEIQPTVKSKPWIIVNSPFAIIIAYPQTLSSLKIAKLNHSMKIEN